MDYARAYCFSHFSNAAAAGNAALLMIALGQLDVTPEDEADIRKRVALATRMMAAYA